MTHIVAYKVEYELPHAVEIRCIALLVALSFLCSTIICIVTHQVTPDWITGGLIFALLIAAIFAPRFKTLYSEDSYYVFATNLIRDGKRIIKSDVKFIPVS